MDELLPCPFCGSIAFPEHDMPDCCGWVIVCYGSDCMAMGPRGAFESVDEAIKAWNRRAPVKTETTEDARTKERVTR